MEDVPIVGGKNASLGEMTRELAPLGIRVPEGFAIQPGPTGSFWRTTDWRSQYGRFWAASDGRMWKTLPAEVA